MELLQHEKPKRTIYQGEDDHVNGKVNKNVTAREVNGRAHGWTEALM